MGLKLTKNTLKNVLKYTYHILIKYCANIYIQWYA